MMNRKLSKRRERNYRGHGKSHNMTRKKGCLQQILRGSNASIFKGKG